VLATNVAACSAGPATGPCAGGTTSAAGAGQPAPVLTGTTLDGAPFDLASLRGRPVIVNFWASWCIPCRAEFPLFVQALQAYGADGLSIVGVDWPNDDLSAARAFVASHGATWPTVVDPEGMCGKIWTVVAPPQTYFISRSGTIVTRQIGEVFAADFQRQLSAILE
jgi:cytochrome c biogenesis protein CcmG/thiol:disulfide interchange protein DsbE